MSPAARFVPKVVGSIREPVPQLVAMCQALLRLAESGELRALAFACVTADGTQPDGAINSDHFASSMTSFALTAAIHGRMVPMWQADFMKDRP